MQRWTTKLAKKSGSANTRRVYLSYLLSFCQYTDNNLDELIAERSNLESTDEFTRRRTDEMLEDHLIAPHRALQHKMFSGNSPIGTIFKASRRLDRVTITLL